MESARSRFLQLTAALGLAAYWSATLGGGAEPRVPESLDGEVTQLALTWKAGVGAQEYEYYAWAGRIADNLFRHEPVAANAAAVTLLENLVAKRANSSQVRDANFEVGASDLVAMAKVARFLLAEGNAPIGPPVPKMQPLAKMLGLVRMEIVPDYVPKQVVSNVAPPPGVPGMAGMDPEAIIDPVAREKYQAAIRDNRLSNLTNKRQRALHEMEAEFADPIVESMKRAATADKTAQNIVRQSIIDARLTEPEKSAVMQALRP